MNKITFSHIYKKMPNVNSMLENKTQLLHVFIDDIGTILPDFRQYDTAILFVGNYPLPKKGRFMFLILKTDKTLWTTFRRWTPKKEKYYVDRIGEFFKIVIKE